MVGISNILKETFKLKKEKEKKNLEEVDKDQHKDGDTKSHNREDVSDSAPRTAYRRWCLPLNYEDLFNVNRPTLGRYMDVVVFRAFVCAIIKYLGFNSIHKIYHAGEEFGRSLGVKTMDDLIMIFRELGIGIVKVVEESPVIKVRIYESVFCSGFPNIGECVCHYERGILAGCFESILNKRVKVVETRCCACGNDYCEFEVHVLGDLNK